MSSDISIVRSIIFAILTMISLISYAETPRSIFEVNMRSQIEEDLARKYRAVIATAILPKDFSLSVQAQVSFLKTKTSSPQQVVQNLGLISPSVGLIDSSALIDNLQEELRSAKLQTPTAISDFSDRNFSIDKVDFQVGLNPEFGPGYVTEFESWMKSKIKSDFGNRASVKVQLVKASPQEKELPKEKSFLENLKDFQSILSFAILSLAILLGIALYRALAPKASTKPVEYNLNLNQTLPQILEPPKVAPVTEPVKVPVADQFSAKNLKELQFKVCALVSQLGTECQIAVDRWIGQELEPGLLKTALFFDCSLIESLKGESDFMKIQMNESESQRIFQKMTDIANIPFNEKVRVLESVYWDLLALKSLGQNAFISPFSYLDSSISEKINVIDQEPTKVRSLIALNLPREAQVQWARSTEGRIVEDVVFEALKMNSFSQAEVMTLSQSMKTQLQSGAKDSRNIYSILPQFFLNLSMDQEFKVLKRLKSERNPQISELQKHLQSLFFFENWKSEYRTDFVASLESKEIVAWLKIDGTSKEAVLSAASSFVRTIVEEDLAQPEESLGLAANKTVLRQKLSDFISKNGGQISDFISEESASGGLRAA